MRKLKLFFACLLMAVLSIGQVWAAEDDTHDFEQSISQSMNNCATFSDIVIAEQSYPVKSVVITYAYNKTIKPHATVTIGTTEVGTQDFESTGNLTTFSTLTFTPDSPIKGAVTISNTAGTSCSGSSKGTLKVTNVQLVEGPSAAPATAYTVQFNTGTGNPEVASKTESAGGQGIALPAGPTPACSADGWVFAGWAETAVASETTTAPTLLSGTYHPTANVTLYAVYKRSTGAVFDGTEGGDFYIYAEISGTKYYATAFAKKPASTTDVNSAVKYTFEKIVEDAKTYFAIKSGDNYLSYGTSGTDFTFTGTDPYKWEPAAGTQGTWRMKATTGSGRSIVYRAGTVNAFAPYASSNVNGTEYFDIEIGAGTTYYLSAPTCCTPLAITIASGIEHGTVEADKESACEGATVTLTFTPAGGYHLDSWSVNGTEQDVAENTFTMPDEAVTVSATFEHDPCDNLGAPTLDGEIAKTYNSATIAWNEVADAEAYAVSVVNHATSESVFAGNVDALSKALADLEPETQYDYTIMAVGDGTIKCADGNGVLEGNFTTNALPTAHLTLMNLGEEHASSGDYAILTPFNLPTTAAACSKAFVGWDADPDCATAPTYAKGAEFTFANTTGVTLYAVYADETPGAATLTKLGNGATFADGDKLVIAAKGTNFGLYFENAGSSYIKNWEFEGDDPVLSELADAKKILTLEKSGDNWKFGDATNGYFYSSSSNNLEISTTNSSEFNSFSWNNTESAFTITKTDGRYLNCRTDLTSGNANLWRFNGTNTNSGSPFLNVYKYALSASTYSNYATTCVAAPEAIVDPEEVNAPAAGVANGVIVAAYENVNEAEVAVALYSNAACTEAFEGSWLTASINGDKNIAYTIAENTSYNDIRTAYIKLTAPETNAQADPAVVVIPVEQARKPAVFANLADLVSANVNSGIEVTVSFTDEVITDDHYISQGTKRAGVMLTTEAANDKAIEIFYNKGETVVPAAWVIGGSLSATSKTFTWTSFNDQWELVPLGNDWTWDNGDLTYTAPKTVSSVVVTGAPTKTTYVDGEKFAPAGLTVTVNYSDATSEVNPVGVTFACDPVRVAMSDDPVSVNVIATYNSVPSEAFEVTGLTVGDIQLKTVAEFIAAGNADMRCYLEGTVSDIETGSKLKYGNFNLTDASGTIYVYGCLDQNGDAEQFESLGVNNGDKIKVIAEDYDYYNSKHEAKNVQFVSKTPAATISIDDIDMETGDELALSSIVATITPAAAESATITYEVTEGTAVSISEGKIIANAEGVATITASIAEGVGYLAANTTFTVTVTAPDTRKKAILNAPYTALNGDLSSTDIKYTTAQGGGTAVPAITAADKGSYIRLYKIASGNNYGGCITFNAVKGCKIDQVQITVGANASLAYCKDAEAIPTSGAESVSKDAVFSTLTGLDAESVTVVNLSTSNAFDVAAIKVYYNGDPLAVHHYFLGGTYATEFEQYGTFNYEGLTVTAAYDEQETITEPVSGFTVEADLMTAGAKKAYVYLNDVEIAQYDITVNAATKENPALAYTPNVQEIAAEDVASWSAPAFSNTFNVSPITYTSNKTSVATVDENGVIALAGGYGTAIITATFAEDDDYIASVATYTITVNEPVEDLSGTWVVAKSVAAGDRIIIGATYQGNTKTMGAQNDNNRAAVASTLAEGILTPAEGTKTFTLVDAGDGKFAIRALNGKYLTASGTGTKNYLTEADDYTEDNAKWTVSIDNEGVASIVALSNNRNDLQYNNGNTIFSCYATDGQKPVNIYKIGTPDYGSYQRTGLTAGNYGTICLPKAGTIEGATLYSIGSYDGSMIYVDEVGTTLAAGVPYIFQATDDHLTVTYTSATVVETAGSANGLFGFYNLNDEDAQKNLDQNDGNYILYQNQYWLVSGRAAYIANYRAYIKISAIQNAQPAPGIRRVAMQVNGQNTTTGVDNLNAGETPVKVMINGQMYILRGEKMYNANGQLVK